MLTKDVMTAEVVSVAPDDDVAHVASVLLKHGISAAPVVDRTGRLQGIVSEADLMRRAECGASRSWWLSLLADKTVEFTRDLGTRARDVMTANVVTVDEDAPISSVAHLLEANGIKRAPVLRQDRLVGIVSRSDILRGLAVANAPSGDGPSVSDREIRDQVLQLIKQHTSTSLSAVSVIVVNGTVYLWGTADTAADKNAIRVAAENVAGVARVHDFLSTVPQVLQGV